MGCDICGRGNCIRSFHSLAEQERFDNGDCEECEGLNEEIESLKQTIAERDKEIEGLLELHHKEKLALHKEIEGLKEKWAEARAFNRKDLKLYEDKQKAALDIAKIDLREALRLLRIMGPKSEAVLDFMIHLGVTFARIADLEKEGKE